MNSGTQHGGRCEFYFYNDPDGYPPILNAARILAARGWHVRIVCRRSESVVANPYPSCIALDRLPSQSHASWRKYMDFVRYAVGTSRPDSGIFVAHDMHALLPAYLAARRHRRPFVYHCHDFASNDQALPMGTSVVRWLERRLARKARFVVVPDRERATVIEEQLSLECPARVVANAPMMRTKPKSERLVKALRERGYHPGKIVFRQGRIGAGHAIETTLRSMRWWSEPDWLFVVMGPAEPAYEKRLRELAQSLGVADRFAVLPPVSYDEVFDFTAGADLGHALYEPIHVNNQWITTASNKIMEYMSMEIPLLLSATHSMKRFVQMHDCGVLADEASPEDIARAVNAVLSSKSATRMASRGRKAFEETYCYERQFEPILAAFDSLAAKSP